MYKKGSQGLLKHGDFIVIDLICLHMAFIISFFIRQGFSNPYGTFLYRDLMVVMTLIDIGVLVFFSTLKNVLKRGYYQEFAATFKHVCIVIVATTFYLFAIQNSSSYSRILLWLMGLFYLILSYGLRILWKGYLRSRKPERGTRALLIVTESSVADVVVENIVSHTYGAYRIAGVVLLDASREGELIHGVPVVAGKENAAEYVCREWVDEVFVKLADDRIYPKKLIRQFMEMGVVVHVKLAKTYYREGEKQYVERLGNYTVLTSSLNMATPVQLLIKRMLDIAGGLVGCLITGILFIFLAPAIYIKSPGPIFFSQIRVGKNGRKFKMYKFRSMYMDAEERKAELLKENRVKDGMMFKLEWDPRIIGCKRLPDGTMKKGIGNYIRDLSLDEFPQFYNILKGDMSLVGTRPPTMDEWNKYELHHRARLAVKPGLTGMWQVSGRSNITDFEEVVRLDTEYIRKWSIGLDIKILFKTLLVVFKKEGSM